ncbi:hypothetical protein EDB89DRAFT_630211 [Lactarius sanguifluus]|nr:hypothetical protein EDB89DRAFT_630211 [Lactarius sanguifluus]
MRLPDDLPCFERLCSRTVGRPVKDMIREELDQEQDFNDDLDLDSDSDVDNEDSIIARIQDRKQRNRIFRAVHDAAVDPFALTMKRGNKARSSPTGGGVRRPRDGRRTPAAPQWRIGALRRSRSCLWRGTRPSRDIRADERNVVRILVKPPHGRGAWEREEKGGENEDHPQDG